MPSRRSGLRAYLVDDAGEVEPGWFEGASTVGVTAGASAPENLVEELVGALRQYGYARVEEMDLEEEDVRFGLPPQLEAGPGAGAGPA